MGCESKPLSQNDIISHHISTCITTRVPGVHDKPYWAPPSSVESRVSRALGPSRCFGVGWPRPDSLYVMSCVSTTSPCELRAGARTTNVLSTSLAWMSGLWCVERSTRLESSARHSRQRQRRSGQYPNYSYFYINKARSPRIATARRSSHSTHISDRSTPDVGLAARSDYTWHDDYVTLPSHISCIRAARGTWDHNLHL